ALGLLNLRSALLNFIIERFRANVERLRETETYGLVLDRVLARAVPKHVLYPTCGRFRLRFDLEPCERVPAFLFRIEHRERLLYTLRPSASERRVDLLPRHPGPKPGREQVLLQFLFGSFEHVRCERAGREERGN